MFVFTFKCSTVLGIIFVYSYFDLTLNAYLPLILILLAPLVVNAFLYLILMQSYCLSLLFNAILFLIFLFSFVPYLSSSTLCSFFTMYLLYSSYFAFVYLIYNKKISPRQDPAYHLQQYQIFFFFFEIEKF